MTGCRPLAAALAMTLAHIACASGSSAQNADADRQELDKVLLTVELVASTAASVYVWGRGCKVGDPERWKRAFDAIDDRYKQCVTTDSALARAVTKKYEADQTLADKKAIGSLVFEYWRARRSKEFEKEGAVSACKDLGMKKLIETGEQPSLWFEPKLLLALGDDRKWVTARCDRFFPQDIGK